MITIILISAAVAAPLLLKLFVEVGDERRRWLESLTDAIRDLFRSRHDEEKK